MFLSLSTSHQSLFFAGRICALGDRYKSSATHVNISYEKNVAKSADFRRENFLVDNRFQQVTNILQYVFLLSTFHSDL
jgi:hypothetical protein